MTIALQEVNCTSLAHKQRQRPWCLIITRTVWTDILFTCYTAKNHFWMANIVSGVIFLWFYFKVASNLFSGTAPIMTPLLWTLQTIHICVSTSRSAHHYKRRRDWGIIAKMFNGNFNLSQVCWNRRNSELVGRRTFTTWRWLPGDKRTIHQHPEATRRTLGDEVHSRGSPTDAITPPTFKPGE